MIIHPVWGDGDKSAISGRSHLGLQGSPGMSFGNSGISLATLTGSFPRTRESPFAECAVDAPRGRAGRRPALHNVRTAPTANRVSRFSGNDPVGGAGIAGESGDEFWSLVQSARSSLPRVGDCSRRTREALSCEEDVDGDVEHVHGL